MNEQQEAAIKKLGEAFKTAAEAGLVFVWYEGESSIYLSAYDAKKALALTQSGGDPSEINDTLAEDELAPDVPTHGTLYMALECA